jgi:hypothetical protein
VANHGAHSGQMRPRQKSGWLLQTRHYGKWLPALPPALGRHTDLPPPPSAHDDRYSRLRCDGLVRWRGSFALDSFAWLVPPVLNACTRIAVEMCPARSILRAVRYELAAAGMSQSRAARDRGETAEGEENVIAGCCLLLMICNTDGRSWRGPRKPPKLSHWRRKVFPEMGRLRRSRERGWNFIVPSVHGGSTAEGAGTRRRRRRKGGSVDFSTPGSMVGRDALFYTKRSNSCPATRPSLTIGDAADHGPRGARRTPPRRPG